MAAADPVSRPLPAFRAVAGSLVLPDDAVVVTSASSGDPIHGVTPAAAADQARLAPGVGGLLSLPTRAWTGSAASPLLIVVRYGDGSPEESRRAGAAIGTATRRAGPVRIHGLDTMSAQALGAFVQGVGLGWWTPSRSGLSAKSVPVPTYEFVGVHANVVSRAVAGVRATALVRDLAGTPSNIKNPVWMASQARALSRGVPGLEVSVRDHRQLEKEGFGGIVAVGAGSATPPRLVVVTWTPPARKRPRHVVLVGKGITFDTGGISIKPREAMVAMKTDMAGSAVVLATVLGAAAARVGTKVTAVLALAENAFGGAAYRPGDVVTMWDGSTVEIANTDAEGRMVLADAMAFAAATLRPDLLIDVATLTGAATLGLGRQHAAMYTEDDALAAELTRAGVRAGEQVWRMPLQPDYRPALESDIADLRHVPASSSWGGGSITAALFLQPFAKNVPWVHLDIAGAARSEKARYDLPKGPTGYGARLLLDWLGA